MNILRRFGGRLAALTAGFAITALPVMANAATVLELEIDGGIGAATVEYVTTGLERAEEINADFVLLRMDTPGGIYQSTREIVSAILNSNVPVVTYVEPAGAQAASAGTYILLASHVAAMAPTTNVGAATPVTVSGGDIGPDPLEPPQRPDSPLGDALPDASPEQESDSTQDAAQDEAEPDAPQYGSAMEAKSY